VENLNLEDLVNLKTGEMVLPVLTDKEGKEVELKDFFDETMEYITKEVSEDNKNSYLYNTVRPLLVFGMVNVLEHLVGKTGMLEVMATASARSIIEFCSLTGFVALKLIQSRGYKISVQQKNVSSEDVEYFRKQAKVSILLKECIAAGLNEEQIIEKFKEAGLWDNGEVLKGN
jgi:hypothetical protein